MTARLALILSWMALSPPSEAAEGLWRPSDLARSDLPLPDDVSREDVKALGDLTSGPLASVVQLNGCSSAFISEEGLLVTAYHCIWDALRAASGPDENLIDDGFHAKRKAHERYAGPGLTARRTVSMADVTEQVLAGTEPLNPAARANRIAQNTTRLVQRCETAGNRCEVETFDHGTRFVLVEREELNDIRLVFSPPRDVGYFGGDEDNWRWPRHSGDFAFLRVYADRQNRSTEHSSSNRPYRPVSHLKAGLGPEPGTFVAVAGYPAQTWRWLGAPQLELTANFELPRDLRITTEVVDIYRRTAITHPELAPRLQPPILSLENRRSYLTGGISSLQRGESVALRWHRDQSLERWIMSDAERTERWGPVVKDLRDLAADTDANGERDAVFDHLRSRSALLSAAMRVTRWSRESRKPAGARQAGYRRADLPSLEAWLDALASRYHEDIDRPLLRHLLIRTLSLPESQQIAELNDWLDARGGEGELEERVDAALDALYAQTDRLLAEEHRSTLLKASPQRLQKVGGPWFELAAALTDFTERREAARHALDARWAEVQPRYMDALLAWMDTLANPPAFYSDANSTLRVSFGRVEGFEPQDGLIAQARTTLTGLRRKATGKPYSAPKPMLELAQRSPNSRYADKSLKDVPVNFLSSADTTVGNSGSPTFTLDGTWVGILFDGNYEGMATDWVFDVSVTRSIHTDASYVMWYLDEVANADALLTELGIKR